MARRAARAGEVRGTRRPGSARAATGGCGPVRRRVRLRRRPAGRAGERGGATICLLAVGLVFVVVGLFGAAVASARAARQQARVAADFAALGGAGRALDGAEVACGRATEIAAANGGRLVSCRLDGLDVLVTAQVTVAPLPGLTRVARVSARAGPVRG
ncbi:helicase [Micromonospora sp. S4605]|uniref:Rv3654c family TadE-like protein n=1 Tax=Micromonospora TaxID=1873 RepID=UPI000D6FA3E7|nr:helicase [Micromonospora sp. S4605]